ncbi:MAG: PhzF family phenazine biosynthesis protein [Burkholderiaceae bacterium]|nr:PhzF family phenazine biosynthesis protein [Microbacteriaceae bacterium]
MTTTTTVLRYAAFAAAPGGGNPAGVVLGADLLDDERMQRIATDVGYAESAFVTESVVGGDPRAFRLRFFSPGAEVPFCGHATVATAIVLAGREGEGAFTFETPVGPIVIDTATVDGTLIASFTSVEPEVAALEPGPRAELLGLLGARDGDLDIRYPLLVAFAGNWHPIVMLRDRELFDTFRFDPVAVRRLMDAQGWHGTVSVLFADTGTTFSARNLFPVGTLTEDPATGSAAASLGGYLRLTSAVSVPIRIEILQGSHVGRPSRIVVEITAAGGIIVRGTATEIA